MDVGRSDGRTVGRSDQERTVIPSAARDLAGEWLEPRLAKVPRFARDDGLSSIPAPEDPRGHGLRVERNAMSERTWAGVSVRTYAGMLGLPFVIRAVISSGFMRAATSERSGPRRPP